MKLSYKLQWFKTISRREILAKYAYSIMIIFYMCLISKSAVSGQSRVACRDFVELWLPKKKEEKFVFLTDNVTQGSKTKYEKKNLKSGLWPGYWYFSWLRTKINNWKIRHWPISAVNMKIFLWLVRKKSITENFVKRKLRPLSVSVMVERFFSSWALSPTRYTTFFCGLWNL